MLATATPDTMTQIQHFYRPLGWKTYEMKDWLGTPRLTFSDIKQPDVVNNPYANYTYHLDYLSATTTYPFGARIDSLSFEKPSFRFGFTGHLKDNNIRPDKGDGANYSTLFREYDLIIGRWWSLDPLRAKYAGMSPYNYAANNPISLLDRDGDELIECDDNGNFTNIKKDGNKQWSILFNNKSYPLMDQINDVKNVKNGRLKSVIFVPLDKTKNILKDYGAFSPENRKGKYQKLYFYSQGTEIWDYSTSALPNSFKGVPKIPMAEVWNGNTHQKEIIETCSIMFIPEGDGYAYNEMNFSNFYWGATGSSIGVPLPDLLLGANLNSYLFPGKNGYPSQKDSDDDQYSIRRGDIYAKKNNFKSIIAYPGGKFKDSGKGNNEKKTRKQK